MNKGEHILSSKELSEKLVLVIRSAALGDMILTLPAIAALRSRVRGVELLGRLPGANLAHGSKLASVVHSIDRCPFHALFDQNIDDSELLEFLGRFDLVVSWSCLELLSEKLAKLDVELISSEPFPPPDVHAADHFMETLVQLGVSDDAVVPFIQFEETDILPVHPSLSDLTEGGFVALHPSSGNRKKNWPAERFLSLARLVHAEGLQPLWVQGEADTEVVQFLYDQFPAMVARDLHLFDLARVLSKAAVYVGNDSGVSHLAAAVGTPTLAIFGPTNPNQWAPRGRLVRIENRLASSASIWKLALEMIQSY